MGRTAQHLNEGTWTDIEFKDLKKGMTFKLFDDGVPVMEGTQWQAESDAYMNDKEIHQIEVSVKLPEEN